jgi:hypothetical protein
MVKLTTLQQPCAGSSERLYGAGLLAWVLPYCHLPACTDPKDRCRFSPHEMPRVRPRVDFPLAPLT